MTSKEKQKRESFSPIQEKILKAFIDICYEEGISNVTLQKVASRSKVAFGSVRYHFAGEKMDLLRAGVFYVVKIGQDYIQKHLFRESTKKNYNGVHEYISGFFRWYKEYPRYGSYLFNFYYHCTTDVEMYLDNREFLNTARARLKSLILEAVGSEHYTRPKHIDLVVQQIHALLVGSILVAASEKERKIIDQFCTATIQAADQLLKT
jgi:AcrR family transcriptional regulator